MTETTYTYQAPPEDYIYRTPSEGGEGLLTGAVIQRASDGAFIPLDLANQDYQDFLTWIDKGNAAPEGWSGPTNDAPSW